MTTCERARLQVLIVEDVAVEAELAARRLELGGCPCTWRRVDSEAAFRAALHELRPDLILSDFTLPQFDGMTALSIAAREAPDVPFIYLSGTLGEETAIAALKSGAVDYVLKSNPARLVHAVERALAEAAQRREHAAARQRLQDVIETAQDWIWELDAAGRIVFCSELVQPLLGHDAGELRGKEFLALVHPEDRARFDAELLALTAAHPTLAGIVTRRCRRDGSVRWHESHVRAMLDARGNTVGYRGSDRDVSDRQQQQARIQRLTRVLQMLSGINTAVVRIRDKDELFWEACRLAVSIGGYDTAMAAFIEPGSRVARPNVWAGADGPLMAQLTFRVADDPEGDTSITGRALRSGVPFVCNDLGTLDPRFPTRDALMARGCSSIVALPLVIDGTTIGALTLTSRSAGAIDDQEMRLLREVAANLSFAVQYLRKDDAVRFLSHFHPLTGLARRGLFCERLDRRLAPGALPGRPPTVAVYDIEHLSAINDTFGRHVGDLLLQHVADRLKRHHDTESIGHLDGGTFAVVLPTIESEDTAIRLLREHIAAVFGKPVEIEGHTIPVSIRSGIARGRPDARPQEASTILQHAEAALRQAKESGEKYLHHRMEISSRLARRLAIEHRLFNALDRDQLHLLYQPKFDIRTGRVTGVEALLRWSDPERGVVAPNEFLPVLEANGMIVAVGEWVLRRAVADCRRWQQHGCAPIRVAVNCSPLQLRRREFFDRVGDVMDSWARDGWGLDLEITESALLDESSPIVRKLHDLRALGIGIAIDDFGTGYSSLSRIARLPVDTLKIDRSFVSDLPANAAAATLVQTIVNLARAFGYSTVAEGVETPAQLAFLRAAGCDESQGYLHSRPLPAAGIDSLLPIAAPGRSAREN